MRVQEEMNDNGLKARIAKEDEANQKRMKKELEKQDVLRDFAKPIKVIALPQYVSSTSGRHLIELKNQVQRLMEAHLAPTQPSQVNKITTSCEICSGPHDTQYCMEDPEQAFVVYASSRTDETRADFKQQQSEMTNKIDTVLKAITDRIAGTLPSDTVKNPKLGTHPVLSARSYPTVEPQCSSHSSNSINAIKKDLETPLLVGRGFLATANTVIDCKMAKIAVGEGITRSVFGVKRVDLGEEEAPYWTTLRKIGSYKPRPSSDGVGAQTPYYARKDFLDCYLPREWEISRDAELNPFKDTLVFRRMVEFLGARPINLKCNMWESKDLIKKPINWEKPPKNEDGGWHAKIKLIDHDGAEFTKTFLSIPITRKPSERESPREIIDLDHFYDT
uniref:MAK10-like protein n=1 Tax=Tanacetum cinerariifolium TaxID=118510 RepID=A0A6L2LMV2_TANCI|nr:MAK10-like protein [Tanacetum cinerariifolium]